MVAGEASADAHGASVLAALKNMCPSVQAFGVGGDAMLAQGFEALASAKDISVAGLTEVLWALPRIVGIMGRVLEEVRIRKPRVAVLIDLPDFNLRLAKKLKKMGVRVVYYVSPQVWAWRTGRVKQIKRDVDEMLVILPFEEAFYQQHGVRAQFVGHPLVEQLPHPQGVEKPRALLGVVEGGGPVLALLPGSRKQEVRRHLPVMLKGVALLAQKMPGLRVLLPVASTLSVEDVAVYTRESAVPVCCVQGRASEVILAADVVWVCSGTATLQTALLERPMVVMYKMSWLSFHILKRLVRVAHIALVNLIAQRRLVPELLQDACTPEALCETARPLFGASQDRERMLEGLKQLRHTLQSKDTAQEVAKVVVQHLGEQGGVA